MGGGGGFGGPPSAQGSPAEVRQRNFGPDAPRQVFWRMKFRNQKAVRSGDWKWLSLDGNEFLFHLKNDQRERANLRYREPGRFVELRRAHFEWDSSMPLVPEDAAYKLVYTDETMAKSAG
jgi:hypothetical protein